MSIWDLSSSGQERVAVCRDCKCLSTHDTRGLSGFTYVLRGGGCIEVCRECAVVDQWGSAGAMAQLIKSTERAARLEVPLQPVSLQQFTVFVAPGRPATAAELEAHTAFCRAYVEAM